MAVISGDGFLTGTPADDTITGGSGEDTLRGEGGNDTLRGRDGSDYLDGGAGNDRLVGGAGVDSINGGNGIDTAVFSGWRSQYVFEPAAIGGSPGYLKVTNTADGTFDYVLFVENFEFADQKISASDIPQVFSSSVGSYLSETLNGTPGNDRMEGSFGNDIINGLAGNDALYGGSDFLFHDELNSGNDTLNGSAGNDWFDGSDGDDILNGGDGVDRTLLILGPNAGNFSLADNPVIVTQFGTKSLTSVEGADVSGSPSPDTITGGSGHDFIWGAAGNDTLNGAGGNDYVEGGPGDDVLRGSAGDDVVFGGGNTFFGGEPGGNDQLFGGAGNDWLVGHDGDDALVGGAGRDILNGGDGSDTMTGSDGADVFIFSASALGTTRDGEHDVITDLVKGSDKLDLSALYESHPIGSISAGSAAEGEAVSNYGLVVNQSGASTFIYGDTDGVAGADFVIELVGSINLTSANLITTQAQWTGVTGLPYDGTLSLNDEGMLHQDEGAPYYWFFAIGFDA